MQVAEPSPWSSAWRLPTAPRGGIGLAPPGGPCSSASSRRGPAPVPPPPQRAGAGGLSAAPRPGATRSRVLAAAAACHANAAAAVAAPAVATVAASAQTRCVSLIGPSPTAAASSRPDGGAPPNHLCLCASAHTHCPPPPSRDGRHPPPPFSSISAWLSHLPPPASLPHVWRLLHPSCQTAGSRPFTSDFSGCG